MNALTPYDSDGTDPHADPLGLRPEVVVLRVGDRLTPEHVAAVTALGFAWRYDGNTNRFRGPCHDPRVLLIGTDPFGEIREIRVDGCSRPAITLDPPPPQP